MRCAVLTCKNHQPRKDARTHADLCVGHALLLAMSKETREAFVARQEARDMLAGKTRRAE